MKLSSKITVSALTVLFLLPLTGCGKKEEVKEPAIRPVKTMRVTDSLEKLSGRTFPGKARATQEVNLSFRISGKLKTFPAKVGDEVKKGDILASLDPRDFEVELDNVRGQLKKTLAAQQLARNDYQRVVRIQQKDPGAISQAMIDAKKGELDSARAQVQSLKAAVDAARDTLQYTRLKAPFDGTVVETFVDNFQEIRSKQPVVRLVDTRQIEFVVNIPENLISLAGEVEKAYVRFDAFPEVDIPARVKEIGKEASRTTRTYPITLIMDQPEGLRILPGMAGKAWADKVSGDLPAGADSGPVIPMSAILDDESGTKVWIVDEGSKKVHSQPVKVGRVTRNGVVILEGLKGGELIVTAGAHSLDDGQQVKLLN
ncbi:efflux RND transporter periplasmic adaptor subunit [Geothermobacter hydrogeniphilus]|uniref:Uncharacterized protein n=1 Tax=Geothermobacter hydrogeniphilus TaxID=1969733 RepID=A0A1X0Y614_9BACT|nr:efflux RND transporter periplasmic adaptor subunit [Geothermobacter hydrogeniphilus]ORJ60640.1 hypothetical protein B5V00_07340 [Geothermobacter hydrogeniphilus]